MTELEYNKITNKTDLQKTSALYDTKDQNCILNSWNHKQINVQAQFSRTTASRPAPTPAQAT